MERQQRPLLRAALFVPLGFLLWLCHLSAFGIFCIAAASTTLVAHLDRERPRAALLATALTLLPLLAGPVAGLVFGPHHDGPLPDTAWYDLFPKLTWPFKIVRDLWQPWDALAAVAMMAAAAWGWLSPRFRLDRGLALAAVLLGLVYAVMPDTIRGFGNADMRLFPSVVALALLALDPARRDARAGRWLSTVALLALVFAGARLVGNTASYWIEGRQFERTLRVADRIPRGTNLATLFIDTCITWNPDRRSHMGGYALARRHAFDNSQWDIPGGHLLQIHNPVMGPFLATYKPETYLERCEDLATYRETVAALPQAIDTLWFVGIAPQTRFPGWLMVAAEGDSVLYRRLR